MKPDEQHPTAASEGSPPPIQFVDGHFFFCRRLTLPEAITPAEIPAFVELSLEELSPFPVEQLAWGWLADPDTRHIFLYAACRPRLPADITHHWPTTRHVFPAFLPLLLIPRRQATTAALRSTGSLTLLRFEPGSNLPTQSLSEPLSPEADDDALRQCHQRLRQRLKIPSSLHDSGILTPGSALPRKTSVEFPLSPLLNSGATPDPAPRLEGEENLWQADIREDSFIANERKRRRTEARVDKALAAAGIAAALVILLFLFNSLGGWMVTQRQTLVTNQSDAVSSIQQSSDFLIQLEQFSGAPFNPFGILGIANHILRERQPRRIEFKSAAIANNNEVVIQGESPDVEEVNLYSERLRRSGNFTTVELADVRTRGGQVSFTLNLRYNPHSLSQTPSEETDDTPAPEPPANEAHDETPATADNHETTRHEED